MNASPIEPGSKGDARRSPHTYRNIRVGWAGLTRKLAPGRHSSRNTAHTGERQGPVVASSHVTTYTSTGTCMTTCVCIRNTVLVVTVRYPSHVARVYSSNSTPALCTALWTFAWKTTNLALPPRIWCIMLDAELNSSGVIMGCK